MKRIDNREFVVTWMNSSSVDEVTRSLGMTKAAAHSKASNLRKFGVRLPKMARPVRNNDLEVAQLNSLIKKHTS